MKIGIYGGSFNPIHNGHLIIAEYIREYYSLDKIIFVPVGNPSHRENNLLNKEKRFEMVKEAIKSNEKFEISDIEIKKEGVSYSIDTLREIIKIYPKAEFYEIIGEDAAEILSTWKEIDTLMKMAKFIILHRAGSNFINSYENAEVVKGPVIEISATEIRKKVASGKSIKYLVPESVENIILKNRYYRGEQIDSKGS